MFLKIEFGVYLFGVLLWYAFTKSNKLLHYLGLTILIYYKSFIIYVYIEK